MGTSAARTASCSHQSPCVSAAPEKRGTGPGRPPAEEGGCRNVARRLLDQNPSRKPNRAPHNPLPPDLTPSRGHSPEGRGETPAEEGKARKGDASTEARAAEASKPKERKERKARDRPATGEGGPSSGSKRVRSPSPGPSRPRGHSEEWARAFSHPHAEDRTRHRDDRPRSPDSPANAGSPEHQRRRRRRRRSRSSRRGRGRSPSEELEEIPVEDYECLRCSRRAAPGRDYCCHLCEETKGRRHTEQCHEDNPSSPPPDEGPRRGRRDDDDDDDRPDGGGKKGKGKKGNKSKGTGKKGKGWGGRAKRPSKKDRDRWKRYTGRQGPKANCEEDLLTKYREARQLEAAPSTVRSRLARLRTWDRAVQELVTRELAPRPGQEGFLTADLLKKGAAWLRANGYRSADLYLDALGFATMLDRKSTRLNSSHT